jgi:hypothetical protein
MVCKGISKSMRDDIIHTKLLRIEIRSMGYFLGRTKDIHPESDQTAGAPPCFAIRFSV